MSRGGSDKSTGVGNGLVGRFAGTAAVAVVASASCLLGRRETAGGAGGGGGAAAFGLPCFLAAFFLGLAAGAMMTNLQ